MKYLEAYLSRIRHPQKNTEPTPKAPTKPTEPSFDGFVGAPPKGIGLKNDSPQPEADPFKSGFDLLYDRLVDSGGAWEKTAYREPIRAALERMDAAWVRCDLPGFQAAIIEIQRLMDEYQRA